MLGFTERNSSAPGFIDFGRFLGNVAGSAVVVAALPKLISASEGAVGVSASRTLRHRPLSAGKESCSSKSVWVVGCLYSVLALCKPQTILILFTLGDAGVPVSAMLDCREGRMLLLAALVAMMPKDSSVTWYPSSC